MFRLWGKIMTDQHLVRDHVAEIAGDDTRTHKVFAALDEICYELDLARPIWLDGNIADFRRTSKTKFTKDAFVDAIDFDFLEIEVIEE